MFDLINDSGSEMMDIKSLEHVLKTCGKEPSPKELKDMIRVVDPDGTSRIIFDSEPYIKHVKKKLVNPAMLNSITLFSEC